MGFSSKPNSSEQRQKNTVIGQFGEGLKVGALALVRNGMAVSLETSKEKWDFRVHTYDDFDHDDPDIKGLAVYVTKRVELIYNCCPENEELNENDTCTIISPLDEISWDNYRRKFLFLNPAADSVSTEIGTLLLDDQLAGQLYVRGIWVADFSQDNLLTGVDLNSLAIDRDRHAIPCVSEIDHQMSCMWHRALLKRRDKKLVKIIFDILKNNPNARDVRHAIKYFSETTAKIVAEHFKSEYKDKFPILDSTDIQSIKRIRDELRREVFPCNQTLLDILLRSNKFERVEQALQQMPVRRPVPPSPIKLVVLSSEEVAVLDHAIELIRILDPNFSKDFVQVIEEELQENVYIVSGNRVIIPRFLFNLDVVHTFARYCLDMAGACRCREVKLCSVFASARQRHLKQHPRRNGYPAPDAPLAAVLGRVAGQTCHRAPHFCTGGLHRDAPTPSHWEGEDAHQICRMREEDLKKTKQQLEERFEDATKEYKDKRKELKSECEMVKRELVSKERNVDYEEQLQGVRDQYEKQLKDFKEKLDQFLKEKEEFEATQERTIKELTDNVHERNNTIKRLKQEIEDLPKHLEREHHGLVDIVIRKGDLFQKMSEKLAEPNIELNDKLIDLQLASKTCGEVCELLKHEPYICVVCKHRKRSYMVQPCGHYCFCEDCKEQWAKNHQDKCPKCNRKFEDIIKVYE